MVSQPPPFSRRFGFSKPGLIFDDFPASARVGLHHMLNALIERGYIEGNWDGLKNELTRLGRVPSGEAGELSIEELINRLQWDRLFTLVERVHTRLLQYQPMLRNVT
jgi:hypothetical protein